MKIKILIILILSLFYFRSLSYSYEIILPTTKMACGNKCLAISWLHSIQQTFTFNISSKDSVLVNDLSYLSETEKKIDCKGISDIVSLIFVFKPYEQRTYFLSIGGGAFELEIPSSSSNNVRLGSEDYGYSIGLGVYHLVLPDTIVTPGLGISLGIQYSLFPLDYIKKPQESSLIINEKIQLTRISLGLNLSKKIKDIEPYGGIKILKNYSVLKDLINKTERYGTNDSAVIFSGIRYKVSPRETLIIEGSGLGETNISLSWCIDF